MQGPTLTYCLPEAKVRLTDAARTGIEGPVVGIAGEIIAALGETIAKVADSAQYLLALLGLRGWDGKNERGCYDDNGFE